MTVYRDHQNRAFLGYLKSIVIYQQLGSLLPLCQILCHYVYYSYSKTKTTKKYVRESHQKIKLRTKKFQNSHSKRLLALLNLKKITILFFSFLVHQFLVLSIIQNNQQNQNFLQQGEEKVWRVEGPEARTLSHPKMMNN